MLVSLHNHTDASPDGHDSVAAFIRACESKGIPALAITDHDVPFDLTKLAGIKTTVTVIPGIEVSSEDDSHIVGLWVTKPVRQESALSVIRQIHNQGGIAVMVHPFRKYQGYLTPLKLREPGEVDEVFKEIDAVEVYNAKNSPEENEAARRFFGARPIPLTGGSDAHTAKEVGNVLLEIPGDDVRMGILSGQAKLRVDSVTKGIDGVNYKLRRVGKSVLSAIGLRKDSGLYQGVRSGFLSTVKGVKQLAGKK